MDHQELKVAASLLLIAVVAAFHAAAQTWTGAGPDNNWSTGANWSGGVAPASGNTTVLAFPFTSRLSPVVDAPWTVNRLDFQLGGYSISGQPITFAGAGARIDGGLTLDNPIVLAGPMSIGGSSASVTLTGPISGPGSLTIAANVSASLFGTNSFTGGLTVTSGGSVSFGPLAYMPGPVSVGAGGHLIGQGRVAGPVTVKGPGASLTLRLSPFFTDSLAVGGGSSLNIVVLNTGLYGSARVTGTVDLTDATLKIAGIAIPPAPGEVFTIIENDGVDPVVGIFAGLPEGATIAFNGVPLRISYIGGDGNDVTLTAVSAATGAREVPTLSQWGVILLSSLLLMIGVILFREG